MIYDANKKVFDSQTNVNRSVISGINLTVPQAYRRAVGGTIGAKIYKPYDDPKRILATLQENYGQMTPEEKNDHGAELECSMESCRPHRIIIRQP